MKVWNDDGYENLRPREIVVQLLRDGKVYDTQILNEENNWRYTWKNLDPKYTWEVVEKTVKGYTVSIERDGVTFVLKNTFKPWEPPTPDKPEEEPPEPPEEKLPQTGLLWGPVPVFLCAGFILVMIGVIRRRRSN